ncbi:MAG: OmpA family protein [Bacteroidales bacterium]|nr:OmpA family protein [Bacteroidales bacterium]
MNSTNTKFLLIITFCFIFSSSFCQLLINNTYTAEELVKDVLLKGNSSVRVENIKFSGASRSIAYFISDCNSINVKKGIVLSTGNVFTISLPNNIGNTGISNFTPGDKNLERIANGPTFDAAVLEFDFYPEADTISFNYFFGSEEYPEFVNKGVNDVFAFLISGTGIDNVKNLAILPYGNIPVTVDNINEYQNKAFFIENKLWIPGNYEYFKYNQWAGELAYTFQFDGLTTVLTAKCNVVPNTKYHIKIAIADVGDDIYDSGVFLEAGSFKSYGIIRWKDDFNTEISQNILHNNKNTLIYDSTSLIIRSNIEFVFDSYEISDQFIKFLDELIVTLKKFPDKNVIIIGHTDNMGTREYNNELSFKRAETIAKYIIANGIIKNRISYKGHGFSKPIADNNTVDGRAINRRVEFVFSDDD